MGSIISIARNCFDDEAPLSCFHVNSCGYCLERDFDSETDRPTGKGDYQIIFITSGRLYVVRDGEKTYYEKYSVLLYKPWEKQLYGSLKEDKTSYFWVHFNGDMAEELLIKASLLRGFYHKINITESNFKTVKEMATKLRLKAPSYQLKLLSLFTNLLSDLVFNKEMGKEEGALYKKLHPAIYDMENNLSKHRTVSEYGKMCSMSESYFIHSFKKCMNMSPASYRNKIAMNAAAELLSGSDMAVGEIAEAVGIKDFLYFSRKFKKFHGISPTAYREKYSENN